MALARAWSRPFWACNACRTSYMRAFSASSTNEMPRHRRRMQDLAPYTTDDTVTTSAPFATTGTSTLKDEAFAEKVDFGPLASSKSANKGKARFASRAEKKSFKSDGISNLSNKIEGQGLSIPAEWVKEEESAASYQPSQQERRDIQAKAPSTRDDTTEEKPMSELPWYLKPEHHEAIETSDVPWYLQPQHQKPVSAAITSTMAERQRLPDLPIHPPQYLEAILEHLSVRIGLDYLTILDLRKLDPPPALGNNLIMVVGTAISEKHLNVAADRFCAWLRREYKFYPSADGLLGRNESKIKQRRKAKKATALANAGASNNALQELDDGIWTDWICVHAGYLKPHPDAPLKEVKRVDGMVGFGEENNLVTLVVQMFTEEKRSIVDLESLWENILERNLKRQQRANVGHEMDVDGEVPKASEEDEEGQLTAQERQARKKFRLGDKTILDHIDDVESENNRPFVQPV